MVEALGLILLWPFIVFALGLAVISLSEFDYIGGGFGMIWALILVLVLWFIFRPKQKDEGARPLPMQLEDVRRFLVGGSLVMLLPVFARYLIQSFEPYPLAGIVVAIITGFTTVIVGMSVKDNHLVARSSMLGGALMVLYVLSKVSVLDETGRVVAAALGLLLAITVAVIKFRERFT